MRISSPPARRKSCALPRRRQGSWATACLLYTSQFLQESLNEAADGVLEVQRSDLAQKFNCVPSQINYVMTTRFSPEHGYLVESRRGGGGYIRITQVRTDRKTLLMHVVNSVGAEMDLPLSLIHI